MRIIEIFPEAEWVKYSELRVGDIIIDHSFSGSNKDLMIVNACKVTETYPDNHTIATRVAKALEPQLPTVLGSIIDVHRAKGYLFTKPVRMILCPPRTKGGSYTFRTIDFRAFPTTTRTTLDPELIIEWTPVTLKGTQDNED